MRRQRGARRGARRAAAGVLAAAGTALLLTGCIFGSWGGTAVGGGAGGGATPAAADRLDPAPEDADAAGGAACLLGTWELRNDTFEASMLALLQGAADVPAEVREAASITLSGGTFIRFAAGGEYTAWQEDFTMTFDLHGQQMNHVQSSRDSATYGADDDVLWVSGFVQHEWNAEMRVEGLATVSLDGGTPMASIDFFGHTAEVPATERELVDRAARYVCAGDSLELHADGGMSAGFTRTSGS